jgi:N-formylglutamate deformylase
LKTYNFSQGDLPILVSMPHNGTLIPESISAHMTEHALRMTDTDWFLDQLYDFAKTMGCSIIEPLYSRYVIDLNRSKEDTNLYPGQDTTELCPTTCFDKRPIYQEAKQPSKAEIMQRIEVYWQPYHQKLAATIEQLKQQYGYVLLFEAHSIKSVVPRFFEGKLADFNFGNFDQKSSSTQLTKLIENWQPPEEYTKVFNQRFKGGYITRYYANPMDGVDTLQLELSQATYMNESDLSYNETKANEVLTVLKDLFQHLTNLSCNLTKKR